MDTVMTIDPPEGKPTARACRQALRTKFNELALEAAYAGWPSYLVAQELLCLSEDLHKRVDRYILKGRFDGHD